MRAQLDCCQQGYTTTDEQFRALSPVFDQSGQGLRQYTQGLDIPCHHTKNQFALCTNCHMDIDRKFC